MKANLLFISLIMFFGCTFQNSQKNRIALNNQQLIVKKSLPDTINLLAGFRIGMTEREIRDYVKRNPKKFFVDKNALLAMLKTKIYNVTYLVNFDLYKGKLYKMSFLGLNGWKDITDPKFKEHFNKIYSLLKKANVYKRINDEYYNNYQVECRLPYNSVQSKLEFLLIIDLL